MSAETNKAVVSRWIEEAVNRGNLAVADEVLAGFRAAFPDLHVTR